MRRKVFGSLFVAFCVLLGYFAVHANASTTSASGWQPANGYSSGGKCYVVIGQGGFSSEVPCQDEHPVPQPVRQCAAATVISVLSAEWFGFPLIPSAGSTAAGCLANLF